MEVLEYDKEKYPGPPRAADANDIDVFFGKFANIEILNRAPEVIRALPDLKVEIAHYFLTPKH